MRCLQCGKRLALLRKLRDGEFCSDLHREQFTRVQEEMALARLIELQQATRRPAAGRATFSPADAGRRQAPPAARLIGLLVPARPSPLALRIPVVEAFPFELAWLYPHYEFQRPRLRLLRAATVHRLPAIARPVALLRQSDAGDLLLPAVWPRGLAVRGTCVAATGVPVPRPHPVRMTLRAQPLLAEPVIVPSALASIAPAPRTWDAPRSGRPAAIQLPAPAMLRPAPRADATAPVDEARPVLRSTLKAPRLIVPVTLVALPIELPAESRCDSLIALPLPRMRATSPALASGDYGVEASTPSPSNSLQTAGRAASLRRCGPKVASQTPASGNRMPASRLEGTALVSVRYRLPKRRPRRQASALGFAHRLPIAIPAAGRIRIQSDGTPEPFAPPRFLLPPPISVAARPDFSPPQYPLAAVEVGMVDSPRTGRRCEHPRPRLAREPELALPPGAATPASHLREAGAIANVAEAAPLPVAPGPAAIPSADYAPVHDRRECDAPIPASPATAPVAALPRGAKMLPVSLDRIVPLSAGDRPVLIDGPAWPAPAPLRPPAPSPRNPFDSTVLETGGKPPWRSWAGPARTWLRVPSGVKWAGAVMGLAVALVLGWSTVVPRTQTVSASSDASSMFSSALRSVKDGIVRRAAISLTDDFRLGLSEWEGQGDWANEWSYDTAGFVRIGSMALYTPSLTLTDYRMEFLGQIERRGMSWAVRAADYTNYYAVKLLITKPGPLPSASVFRYPVIAGKEDKPVEVPLRIPIRSDTVYRIMMEARGDSLTLAVNGVVVDTWTESRLPKGGVGFFSSKGEKARLRWVGIWHQYDTLGRLCAYLAPLSMSSKDRSLNQ
jgi:hypothetical protein